MSASLKRHSRDSDDVDVDPDLDSRLLKRPAFIDLTESDDEEEVTLISESVPLLPEPESELESEVEPESEPEPEPESVPLESVPLLQSQPQRPYNCKLTLDGTTFDAAALFHARSSSWLDASEIYQGPEKFLGVLLRLFTNCPLGSSAKPKQGIVPQYLSSFCPLSKCRYWKSRVLSKKCACYEDLCLDLAASITDVCMDIPEVKLALKSKRVSTKYYAHRLKRGHRNNTKLAEIVLRRDDSDADFDLGERDEMFENKDVYFETAVSVCKFRGKKAWLLRVPLDLLYKSLNNPHYEVLCK